MAQIRVFLCTYRRPHLLRRALASLLAQTFTDWVCELHNDAPGDDTPRAVLIEVAGNDPRISYHAHDRNWGAVATFNHAYAGAPEPFFSILEDDNWWQPTLLARLHAALLTHPEAELAWANLRFWREEADGHWTDLHRTLWPEVAIPVVPIATPQLIQFDGPLHSNGAMLARSSSTQSGRLITPLGIPFSAMENMRERSFRPPLLLIPEPLANFALTIATSRHADLSGWIRTQTLMAAEFIRQIDLSPSDVARLWQSRRDARPRATGLLFLAGLLAAQPRFLVHATFRDCLLFVASQLKRPRVAYAALHAPRTQPELARAWADATRRLAAFPTATASDCVPSLQLARTEDLILACDLLSHPPDRPS